VTSCASLTGELGNKECSSNEIMNSSDGNRSLIDNTSSRKVDDTKMTLEAESSRMYSTCERACVACIGTSTAPMPRVARSSKFHSGRFSDQIATRSPLRTPSLYRPRASSLTRLATSPKVSDRQQPSTLKRKNSDSR